ncbi:MAG: hypothetical protein HC836_46915 [Richelia sp. RM2_1_2]|nr:hypothetical protein [Richelia sp. RM2_1_2]
MENSTKEFLVTNSCPGVYTITENNTKNVWVTYTENISESIIRNIKSIKLGSHKIKSLDFTVSVVKSFKTKSQAKLYYAGFCRDLVSSGYNLLNKPCSYYYRGYIEKDFRASDSYLYYIFMCTRNYRIKCLGVFSTVSRGEEVLARLNDLGGIASDNGYEALLSNKEMQLLEEYRKFDPVKREWEEVNEALH